MGKPVKFQLHVQATGIRTACRTCANDCPAGRCAGTANLMSVAEARRASALSASADEEVLVCGPYRSTHLRKESRGSVVGVHQVWPSGRAGR
jgi:hypothetical protein